MGGGGFIDFPLATPDDFTRQCGMKFYRLETWTTDEIVRVLNAGRDNKTGLNTSHLATRISGYENKPLILLS